MLMMLLFPLLRRLEIIGATTTTLLLLLLLLFHGFIRIVTTQYHRTRKEQRWKTVPITTARYQRHTRSLLVYPDPVFGLSQSKMCVQAAATLPRNQIQPSGGRINSYTSLWYYTWSIKYTPSPLVVSLWQTFRWFRSGRLDPGVDVVGGAFESFVGSLCSHTIVLQHGGGDCWLGGVLIQNPNNYVL